MVLDKKFREFTLELASSAPVPGGGGACAALGALSAALASMVANLTCGKKKYADVEDRMQQVISDTKRIIDEFIALADEDAECFSPLAAAYRMPKDIKKQQEARDAAIQKGLVAACGAPMRIIEKTCETIEIIEFVAERGSVMAKSDAGVAAAFAGAALRGAVLNVYINTKSMKDRALAEGMNGKAERLVASGSMKADEIYNEVLKSLIQRNAEVSND